MGKEGEGIRLWGLKKTGVNCGSGLFFRMIRAGLLGFPIDYFNLFRNVLIAPDSICEGISDNSGSGISLSAILSTIFNA